MGFQELRQELNLFSLPEPDQCAGVLGFSRRGFRRHGSPGVDGLYSPPG
jgi:hypothetical protein